MRLFCRECSSEYSASRPVWSCRCGGVLSLDWESNFPVDKISKRPSNIWRYQEALPIKIDNAVSIGESCTPTVNWTVDGRNVILKLDYLFPTGSFKDRGSAIMISKIKELGVEAIVEDSSGNAGASVAAYAARAGIEVEIFVPEKTSAAKVAQISAYGVKLHKIKGNREEAAKAALNKADGLYYASHSWNPYFLHGTKTFAFEIAEQINWKSPDTIFLPVGNGTLLLGTFLGFQELRKANLVDSIPRIIGVQAAACAPLVHLWEGTDYLHHSNTCAEGIAVTDPVRQKEILEAICHSDGSMLTVEEEEIMSALKMLWQSGFFVEPTSATALAGFLKTNRKGLIVIPLTGHGLKAYNHYPTNVE